MGETERNAWTVQKRQSTREELKAICYLQREHHTAVEVAKKEKKKMK
jgi:hypothetical protein